MAWIRSSRSAGARVIPLWPDGLLRAEGLEMSPEHQALSLRWEAGEIDSVELERLGMELVCQRLAAAAGR